MAVPSRRMRIGIHLLLAAAALLVGVLVVLAGVRDETGGGWLAVAGAGLGAAGLTWMVLILMRPANRDGRRR